MNIYQKINEIKKEIKYIKKDTKVQGYTALSHDMVTASTRELFIKHGVMVIPSLKSKDWQEGKAKDDGKQGQGRYDAIYIINFISIDEPKDCFQIEIGAQGLDSQDKAPGKTISMAKKMAVLKVLDLESGDSEESRIKEDVEIDIDAQLNLISIADNEESLKKQYLDAINLASKMPKNEFLNSKQQIVSAKDNRKKELGIA